jgi:hypothetical protein
MNRAIELGVIVLALVILAALIDPLTPEGFGAMVVILLLYLGYLLTDGWPTRSRVMFLVIASLVPGFVLVAAVVMLLRRRRGTVIAAKRET